MFGIVYLPIFRYSNISVWLILSSSIKSFNIIIFPHRLSVIVNKNSFLIYIYFLDWINFCLGVEIDLFYAYGLVILEYDDLGL